MELLFADGKSSQVEFIEKVLDNLSKEGLHFMERLIWREIQKSYKEQRDGLIGIEDEDQNRNGHIF